VYSVCTPCPRRSGCPRTGSCSRRCCAPSRPPTPDQRDALPHVCAAPHITQYHSKQQNLSVCTVYHTVHTLLQHPPNHNTPHYTLLVRVYLRGRLSRIPGGCRVLTSDVVVGDDVVGAVQLVPGGGLRVPDHPMRAAGHHKPQPRANNLMEPRLPLGHTILGAYGKGHPCPA